MIDAHDSRRDTLAAIRCSATIDTLPVEQVRPAEPGRATAAMLVPTVIIADGAEAFEALIAPDHEWRRALRLTLGPLAVGPYGPARVLIRIASARPSPAMPGRTLRRYLRGVNGQHAPAAVPARASHEWWA